jgi:hypothetical protein
MGVVSLETTISEGSDLWLVFSRDGEAVAEGHCELPIPADPHFTLFWHGEPTESDLHRFINETAEQGLDEIGLLVFFSKGKTYIDPTSRPTHLPLVPLPEETQFERKRLHPLFLRYEVYPTSPQGGMHSA